MGRISSDLTVNSNYHPFARKSMNRPAGAAGGKSGSRGRSMKLARPILVSVIIGVVLAVVFTVFAIELSSAQTRSRNQIKTEVQDRAELTANLINTLFGTLENPSGYSTKYGDPAAAAANVDAAAAGEHYAVVLDSSGKVVASSRGFDTNAGLAVPASVLTHLAAGGSTYYLGALARYGSSWVSDLVVPFQAADNSRWMLVTGLDPSSTTVSGFFGGELRTVPGVKGEVNYIVDGNGLVVAASNAKVAPGSTLSHPDADALHRPSGETQGSYFQQATLTNSTWKVLLVAPDSALFASVNGARLYVPWIIFVALILAALVAGLLAWRVLRSADELSEVNAKLASVNGELSLANESLHRRAAELARSNEELESFASIASHDLQEPLRKVRTFTEQLTVLEADRLSDKGRDYLARANAAAERMQKLIEDLLKFSRVSTQGRPFERVDLGEVADRVVGDLESQVEDAGARIDVGPLPVITADALQMQQLLQNLISNAIKFRQPDVAPVVTIRATVSDGKVKLTVADNGIGFEPRYAARIFRIFERLHGRTEYPGTGIGLALCRKIADRHGGTIEAASEPGHGATFTVTLPVSQPDGSVGLGANSAQIEEIETGAA